MAGSDRVAVVAALRTAIGSFGGTLSDLPASELGREVIQALLQKTGVDAGRVDEVLMGQVYTGGAGANPTRQAALAAGLPHTVVALTVNMVCGSGLKTILLGAEAIQTGAADCVIAGGMESMSNVPFILPDLRPGRKLGHGRTIDSMIHDGLWDPFVDCHMGVTAENLATKYTISRLDQDAYAALSQQRFEAAQAAGKFADEIIPLTIPQRKGEPIIFQQDEYPRSGVTAESINKLKPAFKADGTVTAANSSGINDGAAAVLLMRESLAQELGLSPMAFLTAGVSVGVDPAIMGIGPMVAVQKLLNTNNLSLDQIDLLEVNEAFAAQILAVERDLGWDREKVNVNGGSIAIGHPLGASGARITVTLLHEMLRRQSGLGISSLCIGGGMGIAALWERPS
jgi:acetyl-CoA C-acetyltransferase